MEGYEKQQMRNDTKVETDGMQLINHIWRHSKGNFGFGQRPCCLLVVRNFLYFTLILRLIVVISPLEVILALARLLFT
jgi:hypothetical protein